MGAQNDLRDREDVVRMLDYYRTVEPIYRRRVREAQHRLDELLRERDEAQERLFVLDHEY